MHRDERLFRRERKALGKAHAHKQRADQAGRVGHGDSVNVGQGHADLRERLARHTGDGLAVTARRNLRHDAAVQSVLLDLGGDNVREDASAVLHHRRRRLVAGALQG